MLRFLNNLRNEPESVRQHFAVILTVSCSVVILVAWLLFFSTGSLYFSGESDAATASSTSPIAAVKDAFGALTSSFQDLVSTTNDLQGESDTMDELPEPPPEDQIDPGETGEIYIDYPELAE